jgi:hypothetical protein
VALGVAPWLALLLWQPVAVGGMFLAVRSLVHSQLRARRARRAALVLALFGGSIGTFQDLWLPWWTWGYVFGVLSLATMVASLLLYDRAVRGAAPVWPAAVLAGLASWLHPWQGAVLGLTIVGAEIMVLTQAPGSPGGPRRRSRARPALGLVAISLPLAYYAVLGRADAAWRLAGESLRGGVPVWQVLLMLAPLLAPALLAYRIRPWSFAAAAVRIWPPTAFAVYIAGEHGIGNEPMHAFLGISVPLAILAAQGVGTLRRPQLTPRRTLVVLAVLALTVPQAVSEIIDKWRFVRPSTTPMTRGDWQAVHYLDRDPLPGGVLAGFPLSRYIPAETGRSTYIGDVFWSEPGPRWREAEVARLLAGRLAPPQAERFVAATGVRFLLADCTTRADLGRELAPIIQSVHPLRLRNRLPARPLGSVIRSAALTRCACRSEATRRETGLGLLGVVELSPLALGHRVAQVRIRAHEWRRAQLHARPTPADQVGSAASSGCSAASGRRTRSRARRAARSRTSGTEHSTERS